MTITVFVLGCILTLLSYCCGTTRATTTASSKEETGGLDFDRCGFTALDHATADLVFFGNGPLAPISEEELVDECVRLRASLRSTKRYANNCTMGLGQVMLKMFVEAARKELEYRCDGKGKEEYLKLTPCLVEKSGPALHKCNVRYSGYLQAITEQNKTDRIPFACCYHAKFERCVTNVAKKCGEEHAKFSAKIVASMSEELNDTVCRKWVRNPSLCRSLPKVIPVKSPRYMTMLPNLMSILDTI